MGSNSSGVGLAHPSPPCAYATTSMAVSVAQIDVKPTTSLNKIVQLSNDLNKRKTK